MKLLVSERMWNDAITLVTCLYPGLLLLRLADKKSPCMDRLYFYTRQMQETIVSSKTKLSELEANYKNDRNKFSYHKMYQYLLQTNEISDYCNEFSCSTKNKEEVDDEDDNVSQVSNDLTDDDNTNEKDSNESGTDDELDETPVFIDSPDILGERVLKDGSIDKRN